jgi:SAM-dependent methyltransferase
MNSAHTDMDATEGFAPLMDWLLGPIRMALLHAAIEFAIPDILAETSDADEVARRIGAHPGNTRRMLDAMSAQGLVTKRCGQYANTPLAERYLRSGKDTCLADMVRRLSGMQHRNLERLCELVRSGPPELRPEEKLENPEIWRQAARSLAAYQRSGLADLASDLVAALPEAPHLRRMLDLGGGPGLVGMTIVQRRPGMTGTLCELPVVAEIAQREAEDMGLAERLSVLPGDYNTLDFGRGYDLMWASHTLYYAKDLTAFFRKALDALSPGGVFLSLHEGLERERSWPEHTVLSRLSLALEGQEVSFEAGQIAHAMLEAGFQSVESRQILLATGPARLDTARKAGRLPESRA